MGDDRALRPPLPRATGLDAVQRLVRPASEEATGTDAGEKNVAAVAAGEVVELPAESHEPCWDRTSDPLLKSGIPRDDGEPE